MNASNYKEQHFVEAEPEPRPGGTILERYGRGLCTCLFRDLALYGSDLLGRTEVVGGLKVLSMSSELIDVRPKGSGTSRNNKANLSPSERTSAVSRT